MRGEHGAMEIFKKVNIFAKLYLWKVLLRPFMTAIKN